MKRQQLKIGTKVLFHSGNFAGLTGVITHLDWESKEPGAIFGFYHTVKLSDGRTGYIEKSEHFEAI